MDKEPSVVAVNTINKQPGLYDFCWTTELFYGEKWEKKLAKKKKKKPQTTLQLPEGFDLKYLNTVKVLITESPKTPAETNEMQPN